MSNVFEIRNLECGYDNEKVLEVKELDIKKGELIVILGNSGSGKTTLLETLGLMTNRRQNGVIRFLPDHTNIVPYSELWEKGKRDDLIKIRKEHLNFIFQDNNLMINLSNLENVVLADLINDHKKRKNSEDEAKQSLDDVFLPFTIYDRLPIHISGGEKQRVAFARGIQPKFTVLFGDEPTGNLDEKNSTQLMGIVRDRITKDKSRTAIIVSHNIELSLKHADRIIILSKPTTEQNFYEILPENVIEREEMRWFKIGENGERNILPNPRGFIEDILDSNLEKTNQNEGKKKKYEIEKIEWIDSKLCKLALKFDALKVKVFKRELKINPEFLELFLIRENDELTKRKNWGFWLFMVAVMVTLGVMGWTNRKMVELEKSMKDPFVNSLDFSLKDYHKGPIREILNIYKDSHDTIEKYKLEKISYFSTATYTFMSFDSTISRGFHGRSIEFDDPLLNKIVDKNINNALGRKFHSPVDEGIIVTRSLLRLLKYDTNSPFLLLSRDIDDKNYTFPIPVIAVVDQLPGTSTSSNDFLVTTKFYDSYDGSSFPINNSKSLRIVCFLNDQQISAFSKILSNAFTEIPFADSLQIQIEYQVMDDSDSIPATSDIKNKNIFWKFLSNLFGKGTTDDLASSKLYSVKVILTPELDSTLDAGIVLYSELLRTQSLKRFFSNNPDNVYDVQLSFFSKIMDLENSNLRTGINFLFSDPKLITEFAENIKSSTIEDDEVHESGVVLDMSKVNSMFTFSKVSRLTNTILFLIIFFSVFAISLYIYQLLDMHLYKIRRNIGTLMACGLNTRSAYKLLVFTFVFVCYFIPLVVFILLELIFPSWFTFLRSTSAILFTLFTTFCVFLGLFIVFKVANCKYFNKTPSDLIYSRTVCKPFDKTKIKRFFSSLKRTNNPD